MTGTGSHTDHQSRLDWWRLILPYAYPPLTHRDPSARTRLKAALIKARWVNQGPNG
jgi:hypothetical protein